MRRADHPAIEIAAKPRQRVAAPEDGVVVFANRFRSYGLLLIIEHDSEYHTLLWGFSSLDIELGDHIQAGQIVGTAGTGQSPKLHVELRRNGEPVSPELWLAASNSGVKG
jgi:septal ring factor EnvC (AmiA/AmiB activator)